MVVVKHGLKNVEELAEHYNYTRSYFWARFRGSSPLPPGVSRNGRNYRIDLELFDPWFRGQKEGLDPPPPPPVQDHPRAAEPSRDLDRVSSRLDLLQSTITALQATVTAQGEKLDNIPRQVMSALKQVIGGGNHRGSRSRSK
jgi:hypothetical protein